MSILLTLHILVVVAFAVRILLRDDLTPPARLAWLVMVILLPYIGSVFYFLFGENDIGKSAGRRHEEVFADIKANAARFMGDALDIEKLIEPVYRPAFRYGASINGFYPRDGNAAELMVDASATRARMVADIDAATDHVHVLYYIWLADQTGTALAEALIRAAQRGVTCRAMADGLGSRALIHSDLWQRMRVAGVQLAAALPFRNAVRTILTSRIDLRNHRKITVIDSAITYCGSQNSADAEFLPKKRFAPWVDIMLRFEGPVVAQNQLLFASDWMQTTGEPLAGIFLSSTSVSGGFPAQAMGVGPTERRWATSQFFAVLIGCAQVELTLSTPYFVPDASVLEALCAAAHRGVAVTLIYPAVNDSWIVAAASRSFYRRLLDAGCTINEFEGGLLHAKTLTIDGKISLIGSSNLDLRSFNLNYENNILLQDEVTTRFIVQRQREYLARSRSVLMVTVLAWPWYRRIWNNVIATFGPML
ncbi:MAG: cardiolipin synthase [Dokdonella sp.]